MRNLVLQMTGSCTDQVLQGVTSPWKGVLDVLQVRHHHGSLTLREYLEADSDTKRREKDQLGWIPCSVKDQDGGRVQKNMDMAHLLVLDIDDGLPLEQINKVLERYEYAIHSSYSHSPEKPKWRVVLPLANAIPAADLPALFDRVNEMFDGKLDVSCGHDYARMYFLPGCPPDADDLFVFEHHPGDWLDATSMITETPKTAESVSASSIESAVIPTTGISFEVGYPDGQRTHELVRRAGHCLAVNQRANLTTCQRPILTSLSV